MSQSSADSTVSGVIPMTHAAEKGAENRLHFSGAGFWYVCYANLGPDSSGRLPETGAD